MGISRSATTPSLRSTSPRKRRPALSFSSRFLLVALIVAGVTACSDDPMGVERLTITTTSLAAVTVGVAYADTLEAVGGDGEYAWSLSPALPAGLTLNASTGEISGVPTTEGTTDFTVQVTSAGATETRELSITVAPVVVAAVATGIYHTAILKSDGTLWTTGRNSHGQLGDGTTTDRNAPVQVMSDVAAVAASYYQTLMLKTDGTLWAAGDNEYGQLGDGTTTGRSTPVQVMSDVAAVSSGDRHTLILKTDQTLWATGRNAQGQLGNGTTTDRSTPVQVMSDVAAVFAGDVHTVFLKTDGTLWAMGNNSEGQFGVGTTSTGTRRSS
jgi:alpha-tubulin suppressor-like RCC1 family protein